MSNHTPQEYTHSTFSKTNLRQPSTLLGATQSGWSTSSIHYIFSQWSKQFHIYDKSVIPQFYENILIMLAHNADKSKTYKMGFNQFSHLSNKEFKSLMLGGFDAMGAAAKKAERLASNPIQQMNKIDPSDLPTHVDWVKEGAVTEVKNQGACGSCWAFSSTGALEGAYFKKYHKLVSFSEQELVSCDPVDLGCRGGLMDNAFQFVEQNGLCSEADYAYSSGNGGSSQCAESACTMVPNSKPHSFVDVPQSKAALMAAVAQQPVSIAIEAGPARIPALPQWYSHDWVWGEPGPWRVGGGLWH